MKRIIAKEIKPQKAGIHPLTFQIIKNDTNDEILYPSSTINLNSNEYLKLINSKIKNKDEDLEKNLFKDFMEKPYVPIDNTFILAINNVNNKMISLEEFYNKQEIKNSENVKRVINSWFRYNYKEYDNDIQKNIIIKFFKQLLIDISDISDKSDKDISDKDIKKHLDNWFSTKNPNDFKYNIFSYILKI
jgi:hypothetical protein